jgi:hypothetical protein
MDVTETLYVPAVDTDVNGPAVNKPVAEID